MDGILLPHWRRDSNDPRKGRHRTHLIPLHRSGEGLLVVTFNFPPLTAVQDSASSIPSLTTKEYCLSIYGDPPATSKEETFI